MIRPGLSAFAWAMPFTPWNGHGPWAINLPGRMEDG
jgi:hypothetical protein